MPRLPVRERREFASFFGSADINAFKYDIKRESLNVLCLKILTEIAAYANCPIALLVMGFIFSHRTSLEDIECYLSMPRSGIRRGGLLSSKIRTFFAGHMLTHGLFREQSFE